MPKYSEKNQKNQKTKTNKQTKKTEKREKKNVYEKKNEVLLTYWQVLM